MLIAFSVNQSALADSGHSGHEEYLDFQPYVGNRLQVFNDTEIHYCVSNPSQNPVLNHIATNAVTTWHEKIVEVTGNSSVWDMFTHISPKDESICNAYLNFVDTPSPTAFQVAGVAGYSHPLTPIANVTIYTDDYQSTLIEMSKNDSDFWNTLTLEKFKDIVKNGNHEQYDYDMIKRITLHEIGHSLSLNHPATTDGNLREAPGIMGYNMSYNQIDKDEVIKIVKAYPNGFSKTYLPPSINLDNPSSKKTVHLGEVTNLTIELPKINGKLSPVGVEVYIFPEGTSSQKPNLAPIKIVKMNGENSLVNNSPYLSDIQVSMTHWDTFTKVLSIQFKVLKEFENADMIIIAHSLAGFEKQWFLNDILTAEKALFSNLLLDIETTEYTYHLMSQNPNRELEEESAFEVEQKKWYTEALAECLANQNMKKCSDSVKLEDFKSVQETSKILMP